MAKASFARTIKDLRLKKKKISLRQAAAEIGISDTYVSQLENGKRPPPEPGIVNLIAKSYGINFFELLELAGYLGAPPGSRESILLSKAEKLVNSHPDAAAFFAPRLEAVRRTIESVEQLALAAAPLIVATLQRVACPVAHSSPLELKMVERYLGSREFKLQQFRADKLFQEIPIDTFDPATQDILLQTRLSLHKQILPEFREKDYEIGRLQTEVTRLTALVQESNVRKNKSISRRGPKS